MVQDIFFGKTPFGEETTMSRGDSNVPMISDDCSIEGFLEAIEEKDFSEIISFADKEATAAWRRAYRQSKESAARSALPDRYEHALEELISFLRAALPYRPLKMDDALFQRFLQLRRKVFDATQNPLKPLSYETPLS
jgi:ribosomal protein L12E/L44/L45/RPP1/RPP2